MQPDHSDQPVPEFRDRSLRLAIFGGLSMLVGLGCGGLALLQAALPLVAGLMPDGAPTTDLRSAIAGALVWLALGAVFVIVGWGSITRRRWTRPLMLTLAWTWLLGGLVSLALIPAILDIAFAGDSGAPLAPDAARAVTVVMLFVVAFGGVLLPALFVVVYRDRDLERTCLAQDRRPSWTERCPTPILGLALGLAAGGVLTVPFALKPAVPLFGRLVDGPLGTLLSLLGSVACVWAAFALYRRRPSGWWAATVLLIGIGLSTTITVAVVDPQQLLVSLGYPPQATTGLALDGFQRGGWVVGSAGITVATLIYLIRIRRWLQPVR